MNELRTAPVKAVFALHPQGKRGSCQWCGKPTDERTPALGKRRWWHAACELEYQICIRTDVARQAVEQRDHCICADCGRDCTNDYRARPEYSATIHEGRQHSWLPDVPGDWFGKRGGGVQIFWNPIVWVSLWHVDHHIPLWKVQHLPPLPRIEYFKLGNLVTRCERCHALKSKKESAERAHFKRLPKKQKRRAEFKHKWPKQKLRSRGFPKGHRPMRGKR